MRKETKSGKLFYMLLAFAVLAVGTVGAFTLTSVSVDGATYTVKYQGNVTAGPFNTTVGKFSVDGKIAYCADHGKTSPTTGTVVTSSTESNADIAKVLYYGWGGPGQWSGFGSEAEGIMATSIAADYYMNGTSTSSYRNNTPFLNFKSYVESKGTEESGTSYILYRSGAAAHQRLVAVNPKITVNITINKGSSNENITNGNRCYSLDGAKYGVYSGDSCLLTLTTDSNGTASGTINVSPGVAAGLCIKELIPPKGYAKDDTSYIRNGSGGNITLDVGDMPLSDNLQLWIQKKNRETGLAVPQGSGTLAGAEYTIKYYDGYYSDAEELAALEPLRTWVFRTDEEGYIYYNEDYFVRGDDFYHTVPDSIPTIPLGTVSIQETKSPTGYLICDEIIVKQIVGDSSESKLRITDTQGRSSDVKEQVIRGDLKFVKVADSSLSRVANVPFRITSATTGESHIIVTDSNGEVSTESSWANHSNETNGNDEAYNAGTGSVNGSKLDPARGVWFSMDRDGNTSEPDDTLGALPYDTYIIDELESDKNVGMQLLKGIVVDVYRNNETVELGTLTNDRAEMSSNAKVKDMGSQSVYALKNTTVIDNVKYNGLNAGDEYILITTLMDKTTGTLVKNNGQEVAAEKKFTAGDEGKGSVSAEVVFDATGLDGHDMVVYEKLMKDTEAGRVTVGIHADINDANQTIKFAKPKIHTTALSSITDEHISYANGQVTINDTVAYDGLLGQYQYLLRGTVVDAETGQPLEINGKTIMATHSFFTNRGKGTETMSFTFDAKALAGRTVVIYEEVIWDGHVIASHKDKNDENQTVHFPKLRTTATDSVTGEKSSDADGNVKITDRVSYENLIPGKEYTAWGKLIDKNTGKPVKADGKEVTGKTVFTPGSAKGTVDVDFEFNGEKLGGHTIVVYETLYFEGHVVATHADISDEAQSVKLKELPKAPVMGDDSPSNIMLIAASCVTAALTIVVYLALAQRRKGL